MAADKFFIYYLVVNLTGLYTSSVAFAIGAGFRVTAVGNLLYAVILVVSIVRPNAVSGSHMIHSDP